MPRRSIKPILTELKAPFVGLNTVRGIGGQRALFIAVLEVGDGFFCVEYQLGITQVVTFIAEKDNFPRFYAVAPEALDEIAVALKARAIEFGATPEAIQLLGQVVALTKEEKTMAKNPTATKLAKTKTEDKTPTTNAKASAGRAPAEFTYKVVKGAKNESREGTWGHHMVEIILANTSSTEARAANSKAKGATAKGENFSEKNIDFAWAKAKGLITY